MGEILHVVQCQQHRHHNKPSSEAPYMYTIKLWNQCPTNAFSVTRSTAWLCTVVYLIKLDAHCIYRTSNTYDTSIVTLPPIPSHQARPHPIFKQPIHCPVHTHPLSLYTPNQYSVPAWLQPIPIPLFPFITSTQGMPTSKHTPTLLPPPHTHTSKQHRNP